jgi:tetratricopeptide (TPR) repeat protein
LDLAYNYLNNGQTNDAINIFESYIKENPYDTKIFLQLGYAYLQISNENTAANYFKYVINYSSDAEEISKAKNQLFYIDSKKKNIVERTQNPVEITSTSTTTTSSSDDLNAAYKYLNEGIVDLAIPLFEKYIKDNPNDTKVYMQLGYIYSNKKDYAKALDRFEYVSVNSRNNEEIDKANESIFILKEMIPLYSRASYDLYFYNIFDTYQQNYISNFISHFNFKLTKFFYTGFYVDIYLDNRSKPDLIYNDRYFEAGSFWKFYFLNYLTFELRTGLVREIDLKHTSFNVKPILAFGYRVGNPKFYSGYTNRERDFLFMDIYATALYDYKFKNFFAQGYMRETMRFLTGGYSYFDFYLFQTVLGDTKQLDYNNYGEVGVGIGWKPGMISFPTLFVEASNKFYWMGVGNSKNSFQIKAGFLLNFNLAL